MIILAIIFLVLVYFLVTYIKNDNKDELESALSFCCDAFVVGVVLVIIGTAIFSYVTKESTYNDWIQRRNSLQYQLDYGVYEPLSNNEKFDNSAKIKLYEDIELFNRELGKCKANKHNIWISVFYCADYDSIDYIEYPTRESWVNKADGINKYEFTTS